MCGSGGGTTAAHAAVVDDIHGTARLCSPLSAQRRGHPLDGGTLHTLSGSPHRGMPAALRRGLRHSHSLGPAPRHQGCLPPPPVVLPATLRYAHDSALCLAPLGAVARAAHVIAIGAAQRRGRVVPIQLQSWSDTHPRLHRHCLLAGLRLLQWQFLVARRRLPRSLPRSRHRSPLHTYLYPDHDVRFLPHLRPRLRSTTILMPFIAYCRDNVE